MDDHALRVLEYAAVRDLLIAQAQCSLGGERAAALAPSAHEDEVMEWQEQTAQAAALLAVSTGPPFGGIRDIRPAIRAAEVGGVLEPAALLAVADTIRGTHALRGFLLAREDTAPRLAALARFLGEFPSVQNAIEKAVNDQAEVRDEASPLLSRLRQEIRGVRQRMVERLHALLRSPAYRDMLQDAIVTTRGGRHCVPVKAEYRVQFGGLVHDVSGSGATVFMEPAALVELGNELRQLEAREHQEVERILRELTARVGAEAGPLAETARLLGELDFIFARGRLALAMEACPPVLNRNGTVRLRRARHPLLTGTVVPIDVELGGTWTVLLITGPNTGGKTVALKTVGLLVLMAQSGLHVPAAQGSELPVFAGVYADIGDEQSIAQSLSTFSGHITNIVSILRGVEDTGSRSLVLLDEAGAGTDPAEGAALAKAILRKLLRAGARVVATTHYGELKEFAYATPGVENASVEFDLETLQPTFRLLTGVPGASNAFAIAARLGLPAQVLEEAGTLLGAKHVEVSDVLQRLTESRRATDADLARAERAAAEMERRREQLERGLHALQEERSVILRRARQEADDLVRAARRDLEALRGELRHLERDARRAAEAGAPRAALQHLRERLAQAAQRYDHRTQRTERRLDRATRESGTEADAPAAGVQLDPERAATPGDSVWISGLNQQGTLLGLQGARAQVQLGAMRMAVPVEAVKRIVSPRPGTAPKTTATPDSGSGMRARATISPELKLLGMRADEALARLETYVDEACLAGLSPFRVVHGRGSGALRRVVWEYLKGHPNVREFRHPGEEEGGTGATVVELRA